MATISRNILFVTASASLACILGAAAGQPFSAPKPPAHPPKAHAAAAGVSYATDIAPILRAQCYQCHGPDSMQGGLRLDSKAAILKGGVSGPAIIAGHADLSLLMDRILGTGGKPRMPFGFAPLTATQMSAIRAWIDQGAVFPASANSRAHWAYIAPVRPAIPKVSHPGWVRNPIDSFVLAKLDSLHLKPSPPAAPEKLLRRVYLDLTGLPPSPEQLDAYLADKRPDAYEHVVDTLLASPHYGERMARPWLDIARYADTNGYEKDNRRTIWPYRDWVIDAFNADMPYDQFVTNQVAGDLVPGSTTDDKIATGFERNTMTNEEGGVDNGEQRWLTLVDRVNTTSSAFLGSTMACAECHDHKYDPFKRKEYYELLAYFDHCDEPAIPAPAASDVQMTYLQQLIAGLQLAAASPSITAAAKEAAAAKAAIYQTELAAITPATSLVLQEKADGAIPTTYVHVRGEYLDTDGQVTAGTPACLNPQRPGAPRNRLGLAQWLVDPANPLTARVEVNRLWEMCYGRGLVETSEDFGSQGQRPTNPRLLDWLATELIARHWSVKAICRLIVTSETYRQSSAITPAMLARDPDNRLLARGPRFRMEGEMVRDTALCAAGLLNARIGGPSVFPQQPTGIWAIPYNGDQWVESPGDGKYRRGLYTFWRRTSPYPPLTTFDAPSRELCTVRRVRTDTPLQALTTLNDPAFVDCAKGLARRMQAMGGPSPGGQIVYGFRACTARRPAGVEQAQLAQLYRRELVHYEADPASAVKLADLPDGAPAPTNKIDVASLAALTVVANVMLNLDETLTKE